MGSDSLAENGLVGAKAPRADCVKVGGGSFANSKRAYVATLVVDR